MKTYTIVPGGRGYWIVMASAGQAPAPIERFDSEEAAIKRLRELQQAAEAVERRNGNLGAKGRP